MRAVPSWYLRWDVFIQTVCNEEVEEQDGFWFVFFFFSCIKWNVTSRCFNKCSHFQTGDLEPWPAAGCLLWFYTCLPSCNQPASIYSPAFQLILCQSISVHKQWSHLAKLSLNLNKLNVNKSFCKHSALRAAFGLLCLSFITGGEQIRSKSGLKSSSCRTNRWFRILNEFCGSEICPEHSLVELKRARVQFGEPEGRPWRNQNKRWAFISSIQKSNKLQK